jgi:chaperone required for assembly of F1-ATPase
MTQMTTHDEARQGRGRDQPALPRRFYKSVTVSEGRQVLLDGRPVKTPAKAELTLPTPGLAKAVAEEWEAQRDVINPHAMPLTKLANTAIDRVPTSRDAMITELTDYAGNDLICYRAASPQDLVRRQSAVWDPVMLWARDRLQAPLKSTVGVVHLSQSPEALAACRRRFEALDRFSLVALHDLVALSGSALLGLMVLDGELDVEVAWQAANLDEIWQNEQWGEDFEARNRRELRWTDFRAAARFLNLAIERN